MIRRKKVILTMISAERRLMATTMLSFRNKLTAHGKPTEDVSELPIRLMR